MDDPDEDWDEDWKIDKQTTCGYLGGGEGGNYNVRWVLEKGFSLGRKAVITGVVMSSAPVVLPPMLVVSAVGFACSLPFGLVFTGYACTQKLMSTLLPMPTAPPMLEYDQMFDDEAEEEEWGVEGQGRIENPVYMEDEEKEQTDDLREGVEESIELGTNEIEVLQEDDDSKDIRRDDQTFDDAAVGMKGRVEGQDRIESHVYTEEEEKEQMDDLREGVEEPIEVVKNENEVPQEDDDSKDIRRDDQMFDDEAEGMEGRGEGKDRIKSPVYMEEEENGQTDDLREGVEESIEVMKNEIEVPQEEEDSKDIKRDDQTFDDEAEEVEDKERKYQTESLVYLRKEEKEKRGDLRVGVDESIELVKNENEMPQEEDSSTDIRRGDQKFDDEAEEMEGRGEGKDRIESLVYMEEEKKEQMDGLKEGLEERIELEKNENEVPEEDDSNDIKRDAELRMSSKNISLKEEGYEEDDDEPFVYNNGSSEQMVARPDVGLEESIDLERKNKELFPEEDAVKSLDWKNSRDAEGKGEWEVTQLKIEGEGNMGIEEPINEEEKAKMNDLSVGEEESMELAEKEDGVPHEDDESTDIRRDDDVRLKSENINLKEEGFEEDDDEPLVYSNACLEKLVVRADMEREGSVTQESKGEELMPPIRPSEWTSSREDVHADMGREREGSITQESKGEDLTPKEAIPIRPSEWTSSREDVHADMGREGSITEESKGEELTPKEDIPIRPSEWTSSREDEGEWKVIELKIEGEGDVGIEESTNEDEDIKRASVGLLEKIRDEGNADAAAKRTKNNKKTTTSEGSVELLLPEVKNQSPISENLTVGNGVTDNQHSGPDKMQKREDSSDVDNQHLLVGEASGSVDLIPSQVNIATSYPLEKSEETSDNGGAHPIVIGNVDILKISVTATRPNASDGANSVSPTDKEFVDEEKIREQIDALRTIVGYKSTTYRSSIEEVKALYTFTGVELPSSFGNPPDLAELDNKLHFLMSILGVK